MSNELNDFFFDKKKLFNLTKKASDFFINTVIRQDFGLSEHSREKINIQNVFHIKHNPNLYDVLSLCSDNFLYKRIKKGEIPLSILIIVEYILWENKKISMLSDYLEKKYNFQINFHDENNEYDKDDFLTQWDDFTNFIHEQTKNIQENNYPSFISNYICFYNSLSKNLDKPINVDNFYNFVNCFYSYFIFKKMEKIKQNFLKTSFLLKDRHNKKLKNTRLKIIDTSVILSDNYYTKEKKLKNKTIVIVFCLDINDNSFYNFRLFSTEIFDSLEYKNKPRYKKYSFYSKPDFSILTPGTELIVSNHFCDSEKMKDPYFKLTVMSNYLYICRIKEIHHEKMGRIF